MHRRCMKKKHNPWYAVRLKQIRDKIYRTMYVPDYVTVVMEHKSHYDHIFEHGFENNGNRYVRLSCSAGQARLNRVVFCCEDIAGEVKRRLNNDRELSKKIAPSKFNAYFGLAGSATHRVSEPRFVVVKDFINTSTFMAHFDTETEWTKDDMISSSPRFSIMAHLAKHLPVAFIPERLLITPVRDDVIDHLSRSATLAPQTFCAQRIPAHEAITGRVPFTEPLQ